MTMKYPPKSLLIFILILLTILSLNVPAIVAALHQNYFVYDQDAYMHMVLTRDLFKTQDWYQHFTPRINAPYGAELHAWTQAVSALLAGGTLIFNLILPIDQALYLWGFIVPMLCNAIAAWGIWWAIRVFKPSHYQQYFVIAAFLLNPFLSALFAPLRVDYDFLLITLSIYYWGCLFRLDSPHQKSWAIAAAIIAGLGIWTSISFIVIVFIGIAYMFWQYLAKLQNNATLNTFLIVLSIMFIACIWLEHRHFFVITHDIVSIVHLTFILLLLLAFNGYEIYLRTRDNLVKTVFIVIASLSIFFIMDYLYPGFYQGPYANIDPYLLENFFPALSEFYSPFHIDNALALALVVYFIIGLGFFYYAYLDNTLTKSAETRPLWLLIGATSTTMFLTLYMYRWNALAVPLTILLVSFFVAACCEKKMARFMKILLMGLMALLPQLIVLLSKDYVPLAHQECQKEFYSMMQDRFFDGPNFTRDKIMLVHSNYGPLVLYSTHLSIIASNDHHNPQGVKDSFNFFKANQLTAQQIINKRHVNLLLVCENEHSTSFDRQSSSWLKPIALPEKYSQWQLYRIAVPSNESNPE
jgi:hypothetical protein